MNTAEDSTRQTTVRDEKYPYRVIVKCRADKVRLPYVDEAEKHLQGAWAEQWAQLGKSYPDIHLARLYTSLEPGQIQELVQLAIKSDPTYEPADFLSFYTMVVPLDRDPEELVKIISGWEIVEYAYVESPPAPAPGQPTGANPRLGQQRYLDGPQVGVAGAVTIGGINARFAWTQESPPGTGIGSGRDVTFIDVEKGWKLDHQDLAAANVHLVGGLNHDELPHGTRVLGVLLAQDNELGGVGIAYQATGKVISSWSASTGLYNPPDAILAAANELLHPTTPTPPRFGAGDVLLLEMQIQPTGRPLLPAELESANFNGIRLATAAGIIVVEAAGNGGVPLDAQVDNNGKRILDPQHVDGSDSGAILVAAADPIGNQARRRPSSNFGARVNCFAWGSNVFTTDTDNNGIANSNTAGFDATSAASAIIAGAALVLQGIAQHPSRLGTRFNALQMRRILSDPATGTLSANSTLANPNADGLGVMPNLQSIITTVMP